MKIILDINLLNKKNFHLIKKNYNIDIKKKVFFYKKRILDIYKQNLLKKDKKIKYIGIANFKIIKVLISYFVYLDIIKNSKIIKPKNYAKEISKIIFEEYNKKFFNNIRLYKKKSQFIKRYIKNFNKNKNIYIFNSEISKKFLLKKNINYSNLNFHIKKGYNKNINNDFNKIIDKLENDINLFANEIGHEYFKEVKNKIKEIFIESFNIFNLTNSKSMHGIDIYHGQNGCPFHRLIALSYKFAGAKLISFAHGYTQYNSSPLMFERFFYDALSISDVFYVSNRNEKKTHELIFNKFNFLKKTISIKIFNDLYEKMKINKKRIKKKNILVIGFPFNNLFIEDAPNFYYKKIIFLEYKIFNFLKSLGSHNVYYKKHPDRKHKLIDIFSNSSKKIINEKYEKIFQNFDIIVFPTPFSTTLGFSIAHDKKIILMNSKSLFWFRNDLDRIKKKCSIVNLKFINNHFEFNKNKFKKIIESLSSEKKSLYS